MRQFYAVQPTMRRLRVHLWAASCLTITQRLVENWYIVARVCSINRTPARWIDFSPSPADQIRTEDLDTVSGLGMNDHGKQQTTKMLRAVSNIMSPLSNIHVTHELSE